MKNRTPLRTVILCWTTAMLAYRPPSATLFARPIDPPVSSQRGAHAIERFDRVEKILEDNDVPSLIGRNRWAKLVKQFRPKIERANTHREFSEALNALFDDTHQSHFRYFYDDDWDFYLLRSYFFRADEEVELEHVGLYTEQINGRWFVRGILEGSPASDTAIHTGDEVLLADGVPFHPVRSFRGKVGKTVELLLRRRPGTEYAVELTPIRESLYRAVQHAIRESISVIDIDGLRLAYMHGWTLLGPGGEYDLLLERQPDVDGLLLDYRDGVGGSPFNAQRFLMGACPANR